LSGTEPFDRLPGRDDGKRPAQHPELKVPAFRAITGVNTRHDQKMQSPSEQTLMPPRCDLCGGIMKLRRKEPRLGPHPELLSFRCQQCGHVTTLMGEDER
jgi:hypothetical protein